MRFLEQSGVDDLGLLGPGLCPGFEGAGVLFGVRGHGVVVLRQIEDAIGEALGAKAGEAPGQTI